MNDRHAVLLALAVAVGALAGRSVPPAAAGRPALVVCALAAAAALASRRPLLLCLVAGLLASTLAARSWGGLRPPSGGATVQGRATLVSDPVSALGATRVDLRLGHRHVEAWARGRAGAVVSQMSAGERIQVHGRVSAVPQAARLRLATAHIAGRLSVDTAVPVSHGPVLDRMANGTRRLLLRGAESWPAGERALFAGVVLGDSRGEAPAMADDFDAAGLTHLLAVSGENVAFALALAGPLLRRFGLRGRLVLGLAVLGGFGVLVRWQPSVLRAEAMAALALVAATVGRPASAVRLLTLAVSCLLLVDPLLVHSTGFRLSVGATLGIAVLSVPLARRLPGPSALAGALATTLSAQVGVAPVLVDAFGGVPVASVPANLLAVPAAGPVMVWGLGAGLPAGLLGGRAAAFIHLPTRLLVIWIAGVARLGGRLPLGQVGLASVVVAAALGALACWAGAPTAWRCLAAAGAVVVVVGPGLVPAVRAPPALAGATVADGATAWRDRGATVLVVDRVDGRRLLSGLRRARISRVDLVVARRRGSTAVTALEPMLERVPVRALLGPPGLDVAGAVAATMGEVIRAGPVVVRVQSVGSRLDLSVGVDAGVAIGPRAGPGP